MKSINSLLIIIALLLVGSTTGFSQSVEVNSKAMIKAIEKVDKLDSQLKSENPTLALGKSQREEIIALHVERMNEVADYRKSNSNKEEVKAKGKELNKAMNAKINSEILTSEQLKAYKVARKKTRANKGKGSAKTDKASMKSAGKKKKDSTMTVEEADGICAAANAKQKTKAGKSTEKLNAKLTASDASLALSPDQVKQINALNIKGLSEREKMEKEGAAEEEIKEAAKANKRAIKSILTKEQRDVQKKKK